MMTEWIAVTDRLPDPEMHRRVLIYTGDHYFAGEQYFDVAAEDLHSRNFDGPEDMPETAACATHWTLSPFG